MSTESPSSVVDGSSTSSEAPIAAELSNGMSDGRVGGEMADCEICKFMQIVVVSNGTSLPTTSMPSSTEEADDETPTGR